MAQVDGDRTVRDAEDAVEGRRRLILTSLAQRYTDALSRYFERRVGGRAEAADLVQEVFLRMAKLRDLSSIESPDRYIFATAASALHDSGRRAMARRRSEHHAFDELQHGADDLSPERILAGKQQVGRFHAALLELPARTRDIVILRVFDGLKMEIIARNMGISKRAAEKHYAKAMLHLAAATEDTDD